VNYEEEIQSFYVWLETNSVTTPAIALWHALMHTSNRAGCPDEFTVAYSTLSAKTGLKKDAIIRARQTLQQCGRISFRSRTGQQSAIYQIIPLSLKTTQSERVVINDAIRAQTAHNPSTNRAQGAAIINISSSASTSSSSVQGAYESFYAAHTRVFGFDCNPFQANSLAVYIEQDEMEEAVVVRAIERAGAAATGYNFKLITKILDDYFHSGARTLPQAIALDEQFSAKKQRLTQTMRKPAKVHSFAELARGAEAE